MDVIDICKYTFLTNLFKNRKGSQRLLTALKPVMLNI